jgi:hypothetical protein
MKLWWKRERKLVPRDALANRAIITPGFYVCSGCKWGFKYLGSDQWEGAYWQQDHAWEKVLLLIKTDQESYWCGNPRYMTTESLDVAYSDCFGRLIRFAPIGHIW